MLPRPLVNLVFSGFLLSLVCINILDPEGRQGSASFRAPPPFMVKTRASAAPKHIETPFYESGHYLFNGSGKSEMAEPTTRIPVRI